MSDDVSAGDSNENSAPSCWFLYMLETAQGALYTGITTDVARRLKQHESGRGARALRGRAPLQLRYVEENLTHSEALQKEAQIKKLSATNKRQWMLQQIEKKLSLSCECH